MRPNPNRQVTPEHPVRIRGEWQAPTALVKPAPLRVGALINFVLGDGCEPGHSVWVCRHPPLTIPSRFHTNL